jgi:hypothetical protein
MVFIFRESWPSLLDLPAVAMGIYTRPLPSDEERFARPLLEKGQANAKERKEVCPRKLP